MNALFLALLVGVVLYLVWQWDRDSRRRRAAARSSQLRLAAGARATHAPPRIALSTWLARIAVGAIAAWAVFLVITLFRSAT